MNYELTHLPQTLVGGLAVRTSNSLEQDPHTAQLPATWQRAASRHYQGGTTAAIYTDYQSNKDGLYTEVIGRTVASVEDLQTGDVLASLPAATYAKFRVEGQLPQSVMAAWSAIWQAEAQGTLHRAYTTDLELYPEAGVVEVYVVVQTDPNTPSDEA